MEIKAAFKIVYRLMFAWLCGCCVRGNVKSAEESNGSTGPNSLSLAVGIARIRCIRHPSTQRMATKILKKTKRPKVSPSKRKRNEKKSF